MVSKKPSIWTTGQPPSPQGFPIQYLSTCSFRVFF